MLTHFLDSRQCKTTSTELTLSAATLSSLKGKTPFFQVMRLLFGTRDFFSETPYSYLPPLHSFLSPHLTSRKLSLMVPSPTWILMLISLYTCRSSVYIFTTRPLLWPPQAQTSVFFFKESIGITLSLKCVPAVLCYRFQLTNWRMNVQALTLLPLAQPDPEVI